MRRFTRLTNGFSKKLMNEQTIIARMGSGPGVGEALEASAREGIRRQP